MKKTFRYVGYGLAILVLVVMGISFWAGENLTRAARSPQPPPPVDLGARSVDIFSENGRLSAWFISGEPSRGVVLLLHPLRSNKSAMLARARFLKREGYSVFLVDMQAHGESDGDRITFGYREAKDVTASIQKFRQLAPGEKMAALGVSLGAAAVVLSNPNSDLDAIILESMYPTIEEAISDRLRIRFGGLAPLLTPLLSIQLKPRFNISPSQLRPIEHMTSLRCPVMILHGTEDRHTTLAEAKRIYDAVDQPKEFHAFNGAAHVDLHAFDPRTYENKVGAFLARYLHNSGEVFGRANQ